MSNEALTWAFKQDLPMAQKFVLVALADHADHAHSCFPSHAYTAKRVGASSRTVQRAVHELAQAGYIWVRSETRKNGSQTSNRYVLKVTTEHFDRGDRESRGGDRESPLGVTTNTPGGVPPVSPPEPSLEPSEEPNTASRPPKPRFAYPEAFETFWSTYPLRKEKRKAYEAWAKATTEVGEHTVLQGAKAYAHDAKRLSEPRFTKHPTTWLNQGCWDDDYTETRKEKAWNPWN